MGKPAKKILKLSNLIEGEIPFSEAVIREMVRDEINEANYRGLVDQSKKIMKK